MIQGGLIAATALLLLLQAPSSRPSKKTNERRARSLLRYKQKLLNPRGGWAERLKLLTAKELQSLAKYKEPLTPLFLQGVSRSRSYDAVQFVHAKPKSPKDGQALISFQLWRQTPQGASRLWQRHRSLYPQAQALSKKSPYFEGKAAFVAFRSPYTYYHFISTYGSFVVSIGCHVRICTHHDSLHRIARWAHLKIRNATRGAKR